MFHANLTEARNRLCRNLYKIEYFYKKKKMKKNLFTNKYFLNFFYYFSIDKNIFKEHFLFRFFN